MSAASASAYHLTAAVSAASASADRLGTAAASAANRQYRDVVVHHFTQRRRHLRGFIGVRCHGFTTWFQSVVLSSYNGALLLIRLYMFWQLWPFFTTAKPNWITGAQLHLTSIDLENTLVIYYSHDVFLCIYGTATSW